MSVRLSWSHGEQKRGVQGLNILSNLCLALRSLLVISFTDAWTFERGMTSDKCSPVDMFSEFEGEAGQRDRGIRVSGFRPSIFLF